MNAFVCVCDRASERKSNLKLIEIMRVVLLFSLNLFDHRSEVWELIDPSVLRWKILLHIPFRRSETLQTSIPDRQIDGHVTDAESKDSTSKTYF